MTDEYIKLKEDDSTINLDDILIEDNTVSALSERNNLMKGSPRFISVKEERTYTINVPTSWGTPATATTMEVLDARGNNITNASGGTPTIDGQDVTFILVGTKLRQGYVYTVRITFQISSRPRTVTGEWRVTI